MSLESDCIAGPSSLCKKRESDLEQQNPSSKRFLLTSEEVRSQWNFFKLHQRILEEHMAVNFAEELGLLPKTKNCRIHRKPMAFYSYDDSLGFFTCNVGTCKGKKKVQRATGTWFEQSHISVRKVFHLMYCYARKLSYEDVRVEDFTAENSSLSTRTIADWFNYCREVVVNYFTEFKTEKGKIGGPGRVVQIDKSKFGRRKFNKGHRVEDHCIIGMIEDGSEDLRLEVCPDNIRSAEVLIPLIQKHVEPGTTIHTDDWKAYDCLSSCGFIHKKVNDSDPDPDNPFVSDDGTHTQRIESQWRVVKRCFYKDNYSSNFADWVIEYQWRIYI